MIKFKRISMIKGGGGEDDEDNREAPPHRRVHQNG
jgi:hypothetical protein